MIMIFVFLFFGAFGLFAHFSTSDPFNKTASFFLALFCFIMAGARIGQFLGY